MEMSNLKKLGKAIAEASDYMFIAVCLLFGISNSNSHGLFWLFEENRLYCCLYLFAVMNACVLYFSQTGNTRKFAEAISDSLKIPAVYDITATEPAVVNDFDLIFLGTPVHGFNPSTESLAFVKRLPDGDGKRAILFCTYRLWKGRTFGKLKKELKKKGYSTILTVSAKGKEFTEETFSDAIDKIKETLKK
jgi:flavodoxin